MFKTRRVQVIKCEFCAEGSNEGSLISKMSSEFVWSSIFWVFKLQRVNSVNEFPKTFSSTLIKILQKTWRIAFHLFLTSIVVKIDTSNKNCSLSKSSRKQKQEKFIQFSLLEVKFQGISDVLKNIKMQTKLFYYKHSKLCIYT